MSYLKQGTAHYHYDSTDRLVNVQSVGSLSTQRFYSGSALTNEQRGAALFSRIQHTNQLLGTRLQEGAAAPGTRLMGVEQCNSVLFAVSPEGLGAQAYTPHGEGVDRSLPGFNGEQPDPLTGNYLLGNGYRAYNPTLMRFHSPDNLSPFSGAGLNPYGYCLGDPVNSTDPTGHLSWQAGLGIGLGVLGLAYGGYALAFGAVASSSGLSAASAAVMIAGAAGVGAAGTGIAQSVMNPATDAASTLGWISLGLGAASMLAGVASNHLSPANKLKPKQVSRTIEGGGGPQGPVAVPAALQSSNSLLESLDDVAFRQIVRYLPGDDLVNLSLASTRLNGQVQGSVRPLILGFDRTSILHHRAVWAGDAQGFLPSQVGRNRLSRYVAHSLPLIRLEDYSLQPIRFEDHSFSAYLADINMEHIQLHSWKNYIRTKSLARQIRQPTYTHL